MAAHGYRLSFDAELFVRPGQAPEPSEVEMLLDRFTDKHAPADYQPPTAEPLLAALHTLDGREEPPVGTRPAIRTRVRSPVPEMGRAAEVEVQFGSVDDERTQAVFVWEYGPRLILLSEALSAEETKQLCDKQRIELTWERNRWTDLVEFMFSPTGALMGRIVHPKSSVDADALGYCVRRLAAEADRLRYLVISPQWDDRVAAAEG